jgi:hypothetical protein
MHKSMKQSIILFIIAAMVAVPLGGAAVARTPDIPGDRNGDKMLADAVFLRPLGLVSMALGSVVFLISLPFSITGHNEDEALQQMVIAPAEYTFKRPLGDF